MTTQEVAQGTPPPIEAVTPASSTAQRIAGAARSEGQPNTSLSVTVCKLRLWIRSSSWA